MTSSDLEIREERHGDVAILCVSGPIDSLTFEPFRLALQAHCSAPRPRVVIDCADLRYINSKGLGVLAQYHRQCVVKYGSLALCRLPPRIQKAMDLLGLGKALTIFSTREEALAALT